MTTKKTIEITEIKSFKSPAQPSAWNDNGHDYSSSYALINGKWYDYQELTAIVGENYDGTLCLIKNEHLELFTEEKDVNFYSIKQE